MKQVIYGLITSAALAAHSKGDSVTAKYVVPDTHYYPDYYNAWRCALDGEDCVCDGKVVFAKLTVGPGVTLADLEATAGTVVKSVVPQTIKCTVDAFGSDPAVGQAKQCVC